MMEFSFATAGQILFGPGVVRQTAGQARVLGRRALLVTGQNRGRAAQLEQDFLIAGVTVTGFQVAGEPDVTLVEKGAALARDQGCDLVVGFGGGSVMDAAKAIAALAANARPILDYLEVIGQALPFENRPLPCIAIPTTAGTGSEVTRNAVIRSPEQRIKVSLRSPHMLPRVALVDPELTLGLPKVSSPRPWQRTVELELLSAAQALMLEPALHPEIKGAVQVPDASMDTWRLPLHFFDLCN
jgi:alcohol dehydrogenase class IV